jgi:hypothetical protein
MHHGLFGCVLAILVNQLVFPQRSRFEIDVLLANVLHRFERLYKASSDAFFAHNAPIDGTGEALRAEQVASHLLSARHAWAAAMSQRVDSVEIETLPRARVMCFDAVVEPSFGVGSLKALARCFPQHAAFLAPPDRTFKFQAKPFVGMCL